MFAVRTAWADDETKAEDDMADTERALVPADGGLYGSLTIDNISAGDAHRLAKLLDWLAACELRATFFLIPYSYPNQATLYEDAELVATLRRGLAEGHEFLPHGYDHELFECGVPDLLAVHDEAMMRRIARTMSREMFQLVHTHTRGKIGSTLDRGIKIWDATFGRDARPTGFRAGYHAFCRALYFALEDLGIRWSSTRTSVPSAWRPIVTPEADEIASWVGLHPFWVGGVLEIPHLANYGAHVAPEGIGDWVALATRHLEACRRAQAPFVPVTYYSGLRCSGDPDPWRDQGFAAYERVIDLARTDYHVQFVPLGTVADAALATPEAWLHRDEYRR
jgi:peptidoglycan/xylan/chitin deacetylase (PgdA/CDA1 family)